MVKRGRRKSDFSKVYFNDDKTLSKFDSTFRSMAKACINRYSLMGYHPDYKLTMIFLDTYRDLTPEYYYQREFDHIMWCLNHESLHGAVDDAAGVPQDSHWPFIRGLDDHYYNENADVFLPYFNKCPVIYDA